MTRYTAASNPNTRSCTWRLASFCGSALPSAFEQLLPHCPQLAEFFRDLRLLLVSFRQLLETWQWRGSLFSSSCLGCNSWSLDLGLSASFSLFGLSEQPASLHGCSLCLDKGSLSCLDGRCSILRS